MRTNLAEDEILLGVVLKIQSQHEGSYKRGAIIIYQALFIDAGPDDAFVEVGRIRVGSGGNRTSHHLKLITAHLQTAGKSGAGKGT